MNFVPLSTNWSVRGLSVFIASLIALPSLSIDVVMPGLGAMRLSIGATLLESGLVITLFMMGLAAGQVFLGPFSDRFGRRPVLLCGLALYVVAGIGCSVAVSPLALLTFRVFQGVGAGAGTVLALAIVRDVVEGDAARAVRSYAVAAFNVVPILAPSLGAMLLAASGWQASHLVPAILGFGLFLWTFLWFKETYPSSKRNVAWTRRSYSHLFCYSFVGYVILNAASYAALMAYIAGSSLVMMDGMGMSAEEYALAFAGTSIALMLGACTNGCLARRGVRGSTLLAISLVIGSISSILLAILPINFDAASGVLIGFAIFSRGVTGPNAQQAALEPLRDSAGAAAALLSLVQVLSGAAVSLAVLPLYRTLGPQGVAYAIAFCSVIAMITWMWVQNNDASQ